MRRALIGVAICLVVGAGVALSGLGRLLLLDGVIPPQVPETWAALPSTGRVEVTLVASEGLVSGLAGGLSGFEVALHRTGALALVDGRVFAVSVASATNILRDLSWDGLPIDTRQASVAELEGFAIPAPATLAWWTRQRAYAGLRGTRDFLAAYPSFSVTTLATALLLVLNLVRSGPATGRSRDASRPELKPSPWRRRRAEIPVRVVLVPDAVTLAQIRTAIGEEHVVAATEHAFAFADGWILAVREGSVFELVSELGWRMRPIEMATRTELIGEGHALSPVPGDERADALGLLEALRVCGPVAHGTVPRIAMSVASRA